MLRAIGDFLDDMLFCMLFWGVFGGSIEYRLLLSSTDNKITCSSHPKSSIIAVKKQKLEEQREMEGGGSAWAVG